MMKVSARNQFHGSITDIRLGAVNAEVVLSLAGGDSLIASITKESVGGLNLKLGQEVVALVKAPQVILVTDFGGYQLSARNQLKGEITQVNAGPVSAEVNVKLRGGDILSATVTHESVESLGLKKGREVTAVFKAGAVILAVKP